MSLDGEGRDHSLAGNTAPENQPHCYLLLSLGRTQRRVEISEVLLRLALGRAWGPNLPRIGEGEDTVLVRFGPLGWETSLVRHLRIMPRTRLGQYSGMSLEREHTGGRATAFADLNRLLGELVDGIRNVL